MLDRPKVLKKINTLVDKLFLDFTNENNIARAVWDQICSDPIFQSKVHSINTPWLIPSWSEKLDDIHEVKQGLDTYSILSVDGSQIYPDRHRGTPCYLINVGEVELNYGIPGRRVLFNSDPYVFVGDQEEFNESPTELVNCKRQELEFIAGYKLAVSKLLQLKEDGESVPFAFLFDGSLIFWHLESKENNVKKFFLSSYINILQKFYESEMLIAGYISLPKSKEILNLIRVSLCDFVVEGSESYKVVNHMVDSQLAGFFLTPFTRTTMFKNFSKITQYYPEHLHPHFFYMHVDYEIVRIEVPEWIACDSEKLSLLISIIADQTIKGRGYPVVLAEAHEQAVIKSPERDFFYHLINKVGLDHNHYLRLSQKVHKKMGIGI